MNEPTSNENAVNIPPPPPLTVSLYQGKEKLLKDTDMDTLKMIKQKISDLSNMKNIHFLFGAGASSDSIPAMAAMVTKIESKIHGEQLTTFRNLKLHNHMNLETILGVLYSKRDYQNGINQEDIPTDELIKLIETTIFKEINIDLADSTHQATVDIYKTFYQRITYRNKDLNRTNIFTTNNDLFNERVMDNLNINYNNGFGGGLERFFNPARFGYTYSKKIEASIEKYEALDNMIYLYKLHGSINWIEKEGNSLFNIQEINVNPKAPPPTESVLIYPNPLKQSKSLTSPYSDLIREFQKKLLLQNSALFIIGYSFSDEHLNNIIYQALSANSSMSVVIFGQYDDKPIFKIDDKRIYKIYGEESGKKIHYFKYIVENFIPNLNENKNLDVLKNFIAKLSDVKAEA
jgi:hypothetical protein